MSQVFEINQPQPVVRRDQRMPYMILSGIVAVVLGVLALAMPAPYVIESPGPAINTIGEYDGAQIVKVTGTTSYTPETGALDLTTVHVNGGLDEDQINIFQALEAWANPAKAVYPVEAIYAPGSSQTSVNNENVAAMTDSQQNATAAALTALDIEYKTALAVAAVDPQGAAKGILEAKDVIESINGKPVTSLKVIQDQLAAGKGAVVELQVKRDGAIKTLPITPKVGEGGKYLLGVSIANTFVFPFDVKVTLSNVGGPSAGMMFALAIMDSLTPGEMTGGKHFSGTGTIDPQGKVGPIGGIAQKMQGAKKNGAAYFLAPEANCSEVVGHVPNGLQVIKVTTLKEAYSAIKMVGSGNDTSSLPTCS